VLLGARRGACQKDLEVMSQKIFVVGRPDDSLGSFCLRLDTAL